MGRNRHRTLHDATTTFWYARVPQSFVQIAEAFRLQFGLCKHDMLVAIVYHAMRTEKSFRVTLREWPMPATHFKEFRPVGVLKEQEKKLYAETGIMPDRPKSENRTDDKKKALIRKSQIDFLYSEERKRLALDNVKKLKIKHRAYCEETKKRYKKRWPNNWAEHYQKRKARMTAILLRRIEAVNLKFLGDKGNPVHDTIDNRQIIRPFHSKAPAKERPGAEQVRETSDEHEPDGA